MLALFSAEFGDVVQKQVVLQDGGAQTEDTRKEHCGREPV